MIALLLIVVLSAVSLYAVWWMFEDARPPEDYAPAVPMVDAEVPLYTFDHEGMIL